VAGTGLCKDKTKERTEIGLRMGPWIGTRAKTKILRKDKKRDKGS